MFHYPKTIIFICILLFCSFWALSISYISIANQTPYVRENIENPIFVLLPKNKTEKAIKNGTPPVCWGTVGWFYTGALAFPSKVKAQEYMYKNKIAFPPNQTGIYQLSGDYALDTHPLKNKPEIHCTNKPLTIYSSKSK